jgi:signal transduction histidine kinase/ligand-binding sensor domain-containing protein
MPAVEVRAESSPTALLNWVTTADGLPDSRVEALARDRYGYVWIGTQGGLVRHEGQGLSVLRHNPDRDDSLPGNNVLSLLATRDGSIWAGLSGHGVVRLEGLQVVQHWKTEARGGSLRGNYLWSMAEACDGAVWGGYATDGLVRIDPATGRATHFRPEALGLPELGFGLELAVDARCRLWLTRTDGLWWIVTEQPYEAHRFVDVGQAEIGPLLSSELVDDDRAILGGAFGVLDISLADELADSSMRRRWPVGRATGVVRDAGSGQLWLGSGNGLMLMDRDSGTTQAFRPAVDSPLGSVMVTDVLTGSDGEVWVATNGSGVALLPPAWRGFRPYWLADSNPRSANVTAVDERDGVTWIGRHDNTVLRLELATGRTRTVVELDTPGEIVDLIAGERFIWLLQRRFLTRYDIDSGEKIVVERIQANRPEQFEFMEPASPDGFWLVEGSSRLRRLDKHGSTVDEWHAEAEAPRLLAERNLRNIRMGPGGRWWLLGSRALYRQDADGRFIELYRSSRGDFSTMAFDADALWLGSDSTLERFRIVPGGVQPELRFTAGDGLPAGQMHALIPGPRNLWILTGIGLSRLELRERRFRRFSTRDGLLQSRFKPRTTLALGDGRFAAGTDDGLLVVEPALIDPVTTAPPVYLTAVRAGDQLLPLDPGTSALPDLEWDRNSMEFHFQSLSYIDPARNRYRVRLRGWEDDWRELVGQTTRFYSNLPSGRYRFEVEAAGVDGVWNQSGDHIAFRIAPPPWLSGGAWALYAVVALAATGAGWRSLTARRRRREAVRRLRADRQLADLQRSLLERLNRSLAPELLIGELGAAVRDLAEVSICHVAFLDPGLPRRSRSFGQSDDAVSAERIECADREGGPGTVIGLGGTERPLALVWLPGLDAPRRALVEIRLELFAQVAGQVLENARLFSEVRTLAQKAVEASEAKSDFLATMSHEIRTPLHGLLGMMELMGRSERDAGGLDTLRTMRASGRQLERILNDILDLSRIEAGRVDLDIQAFELPEVLERVVELHASSAEASGLALRLRIDSDLPVLARGDPDRIAQVVGNLISNAIKFTGAGSVELAVWLARDRSLCFSVSDSGPGIDSALQSELFEPFTQLEGGSTRRHSGTGLGLAICRRLVEAMHGEMAVSSRLGSGSRFTVKLPLSDLRPQAPFSSRLLNRLRLATALGAEDHRVVARLARRWSLRTQRLCCATDGFDVLLYCDKVIDAKTLDRLRESGVDCWRVGSGAEADATYSVNLRRPLTESRLIGTLFDRALGAIRAD